MAVHWGGHAQVVADYFSIVIKFAGFCYGRFMAMRYKFNLATYFQRPLVVERKGGTERNLNEITAGSRQRTLAVEGGKQSRKSAMWVPVTVFIEWNVICFWLYTARLFFVSSIKLVNKQKETTKTICDSVNHTRFPKEDHLPDWVCRDKHGNKGDRVEGGKASLWFEPSMCNKRQQPILLQRKLTKTNYLWK
jgi:hypothetical protein